MIEYEWNTNKERWEFMFLSPDKKKIALGYLEPSMPEEARMKLIVNWFNSVLRAYNEYNEKTSSKE